VQLPVDRSFTLTALNGEVWVRTVKVNIDGQDAAPLAVPAGPGSTVAKVYTTGKGTVATAGKSQVNITVLDSKQGEMEVTWGAPDTLGNKRDLVIIGVKDYQNELPHANLDMLVHLIWNK
jgi:hypothetical protein